MELNPQLNLNRIRRDVDAEKKRNLMLTDMIARAFLE